MLFAMFRDISWNLKYRGRFIGLNNYPPNLAIPRANGDVPLASLRQVEGNALRWSFTMEGKTVSFINYYWEKTTYEEAAHAAGLSLEWIPVKPTAEGIELFGEAYWAELIARPWISIIKCTKQ
jgi:hypothetical protein